MLKKFARLAGVPPDKVQLEADTKLLDLVERVKAEILAHSG